MESHSYVKSGLGGRMASPATASPRESPLSWVLGTWPHRFPAWPLAPPECPAVADKTPAYPGCEALISGFMRLWSEGHRSRSGTNRRTGASVVASIRKVIHESGRTSWQARWRDPAGAQRSKSFDRRVDAERHLTTVEARKLAGTYINPRADRLKLGEFTEQTTLGWLNRRDSTRARDDSYLNSLILPAISDASLGAVHPTDVQKWVAQLDAAGYAPATIRKAFQLIGRIFSDAVQAELIVRSPCRNITLPASEARR